MSELTFRTARRADVPTIVRMLADDALGAVRERNEDPLPRPYFEAFDAIAADPNNQLLIAEQDDRIVGCLQLTFIPGLSHVGAWRAQIESVRVDGTLRGAGIGRQLVLAAIEIARQRGCTAMQLTTDKSRHDAHRFYEQLGFRASHEGMKRPLPRF